MSFQEGFWKEVSSSKFRFFQRTFEVIHFSGWTKVVKNSRAHYVKDLPCFLFGKKIQGSYLLDMCVCVCGNAEPEKQVRQFVALTTTTVKLTHNFIRSVPPNPQTIGSDFFFKKSIIKCSTQFKILFKNNCNL